mmetsp:Transcript_38065/g.91341  ORF Transcript_38065/g.91341 Transcript_38065/m.91341 type:complete len:249 (+) Transcript_38065:297-1043(+)
MQRGDRHPSNCERPDCGDECGRSELSKPRGDGVRELFEKRVRPMPKHCVSPQEIRGGLRSKAVFACAGGPSQLVQHGGVGILQGAHSPHGVGQQLGGELVCELASSHHSALHQRVITVLHRGERPKKLAQLRGAEPPHSATGSCCDVLAQLLVVLAKFREGPRNVRQRLRRQRIRTFGNLGYDSIHEFFVRPLCHCERPHQVGCLLGLEGWNEQSGDISNAIQQSIIRHSERRQCPSSIRQILLVEGL